ncbi:unnamed protein product, partial [Prorocentrum cordatum]
MVEPEPEEAFPPLPMRLGAPGRSGVGGRGGAGAAGAGWRRAAADAEETAAFGISYAAAAAMPPAPAPPGARAAGAAPGAPEPVEQAPPEAEAAGLPEGTLGEEGPAGDEVPRTVDGHAQAEPEGESVDGGDADLHLHGAALQTSAAPPVAPAMGGDAWAPEGAAGEAAVAGWPGGPPPELDQSVTEALGNLRERNFLLKLENHIINNLKNDKIERIRLTTPIAPNLRFLVHLVADYFGLERIVDSGPGGKKKATMTLLKTPTSRIPERTLAAMCQD